MAKLIKKSKCKFEAGHIIKKNKVVGIPRVIWWQLNRLETMVQQYDYLIAQPPYQPGPSLEGFDRKSIIGNDRPYVSCPDTPVIDKRVKEAMEFMAETDKVNDAAEINKAIDHFGELIDWFDSDKFIEGGCFEIIDTPTLGNPLILDGHDIVTILKVLVTSPIEVEA